MMGGTILCRLELLLELFKELPQFTNDDESLPVALAFEADGTVVWELPVVPGGIILLLPPLTL